MDHPFLHAWQPLTPRGVAAFAHATWGRLLLVQLIVAVLAAITVVWFLHEAWFPTIREAIRHLPAQGEIRRGELKWREDSPARLATSRFLNIAVDLWHEGKEGRQGHLSVEFGRKDFQFVSFLGYWRTGYPKQWIVAFNRTDLEPWWGAFQPAILAGVAVLVIVKLFVIWTLLGTLFSGIVWLVAFFGNRRLAWGGSWKLASASLLPGALFLTLAGVSYGLGLLGLVQFGLAAAFHIVIEVIYVIVAPLCLPREPEISSTKANPFVTSQSNEDSSQ